MRHSSTNIGSRLQLFLDTYGVEYMEDTVRHCVHQPKPEEVVLFDDKPWEQRIAYVSVMQDGGMYRMYYRGFHHGKGRDARGEVTCYAESEDGLHWVKPELGLFEFEGSSKNNIVIGGDQHKYPATGRWHGNLGNGLGLRSDVVPFKDNAPNVSDDAKYKALIRGCRGACQIADCRSDYGMYPFQSPDGFHWTIMSEQPVITKGKFDSQNLAFWDEEHQRYVAFARDVRGVSRERKDTEAVDRTSLRDIRVSTSADFLHWTDPVFLEYPGSPSEQLYTNAIAPYARAPHILIGFPTRFNELAQTEPVIMSSRDGGYSFVRWLEAVIPMDAPQERDGNRSNYMASGLVRGNEREFFVYATEGYQVGRLRRFTYRVDGFVSMRFTKAGGTVLTAPLVFEGSSLFINYAVLPEGSVRVGVEDVHGKPLPGFGVEDCVPLVSDQIEQKVRWKLGSQLDSIAGQPVKLRFSGRQSDLYSFQFR